MKYRVDLVARTSVVVEAEDEFEAERIAENYCNTSPSFYHQYEVEDGGIEETEDDLTS